MPKFEQPKGFERKFRKKSIQPAKADQSNREKKNVIKSFKENFWMNSKLLV